MSEDKETKIEFMVENKFYMKMTPLMARIGAEGVGEFFISAFNHVFSECGQELLDRADCAIINQENCVNVAKQNLVMGCMVEIIFRGRAHDIMSGVIEDREGELIEFVFEAARDYEEFLGHLPTRNATLAKTTIIPPGTTLQ